MASEFTDALRAGNERLKAALSDQYAKLGISQTTPIVGGVTSNGTAVSQSIQDGFNQALGFGLKPGTAPAPEKSTDLIDQIFNPGGVYNKIIPGPGSAGPLDVIGAHFPYARVVSIGLGVILIGGGILLFAGEDLAAGFSKVQEFAGAVP